MKKSLLYRSGAVLVLLATAIIVGGYISSSSTKEEQDNDKARETTESSGIEQSDIATNEATPSTTNNNESSATVFEQVVELGPGSLPLRSQRAVVEWSGSPLTVFTNENTIYVAKQDGTRYQVATLQQTSGSPTIAASDNRVVVAWVTPTAIMASSSTDLKTWTSPTTVGAREQNGGPIPSADWTGNAFGIVWIDAPKTNTATGGMDGVGALRVAISDGVSTWKVSTINSTAAIVSIAGSTIVWRDDRSANGSRLDSIRIADLDGKNEETLTSGYDPAIAIDGEAIAIGYHAGSSAHLLTTIDGKTWNDETLDVTGKFVAPLVSNGVFGAVWVDYPTTEAAKDARNDAGHYTTATWNGKTYQMNDGKAYTLQGQGTTVAGAPVVVYQVNGKIYLAY